MDSVDERVRAGRERRRWPWVVLVVVLAAAGVGAALLVSGDDDGGDAAGSADGGATTTEAGKPAQVDAGGAELQELLAAGRAATFHATYEAEGLVLEVWRRDGRTRQDARVSEEGNEGQTVGIVADGETTVCADASGEWQCSSRETVEGDIDGLFGRVVDLAAGASVTVTDETVADRPSRCFSVADAAICLTSEGVPTRLTFGGRELLLTSLEDTVDTDVFSPPAEPEG